MAETQVCRYCGATILKEAQKCNFCGRIVYKDPEENKHQELHCVTCGAIVYEDDIFCPVCGGAFSELPRSTQSVDLDDDNGDHNNIGIRYNIGILIKSLIISGMILMYLCTTGENADVGKNILYFGIAFIVSEIFLYIYFLPTIIAIENNNRKLYVIYIINLLLGITVIGWFVSLIMAMNNGKE